MNRARLVDGLLAAAVTAASLAELSARGTDPLPPWLAVPVHVVTTGALVWRRRCPLPVGLVVAGGSLGLLLAGVPMNNFGLFVAILLAAYSVGGHTHGRSAGIPVLAGWLVLLWAGALWAIPIEDAAGMIVLVTAATLLGRVLRDRGVEVDDLRRTTRRLAREREERTRVAVADERARIARELHDLVGHSVSLMVLQAGAARKVMRGDPERTEEMLHSVESTGRRALAEMQRMVGIMRAGPQSPALGPQPDLREVPRLVAAAESTGLTIDYRVAGTPGDLAAGLELSAYRIVQEALTNAIKHAEASRVTVRIHHLATHLEVVVTDDGRAGQQRWPPPELGHGLAGMRERVALYDGELTVAPPAGGGLEVRARFPVGSRP